MKDVEFQNLRDIKKCQFGMRGQMVAKGMKGL